MDAYTVQTYAADWLNGSGITGLDTVWPALPSSMPLDFAAYGSGMMRCQAVAYAESDSDVRRSTPAANPYTGTRAAGMRMVRYAVRLEVVHWSADPDWMAADRALKQDVVAGIRTAIHLDPTLGGAKTSEPLFHSAGEGKRGIQTAYEVPFVRDADGAREQWAFLAFDVIAWETG
ncbi:hypothetical protein [Streptomyces mirabilis]|uniref:hypothetical protein n=1 Tax=Streptomyces mirabilis TaxID=68239 RepID=UPI0036DCA086